MRIATSNQYDTSVNNLLQRQADVADSEADITSGKRVSKASDDPASAARAERALAQEARITASQRAVDNSQAQMTQSESALGNAGDLMAQARALVVQAGNASYGDSERKSIANELRAVRNQLLTIANQSDGAHGFLFGGQGASQTPFVDATGGVQYQSTGGASRAADGGESLPLTVDGRAAWMTARTGNGVFATSAVVSKGTAWIDGGKVTDPSAITGSTYSIEFSVAGGETTYSVLKDGGATALSGEPFKSGQSVQLDGLSTTITGNPADGDTFQMTASTPTLSVFDALDQTADHLETADRTNSQIAQTNNADLNNVDAVMSNLQTAQAAAGATLTRIDDVDSRLSLQKLQAQSDASDAQDLDLISAYSNQQTLQTGYDAALKMYSTVQRLSLFQYINAS